jgi:Flp pilus assembly pilin Flp
MNKHGQSIIEYVLIAVLVILGIVIMGPYVLRSVNAHFKLWDDGVQDSFTENITQAPVHPMIVM